MNMGDDLYREIILENYKSKKNRGVLESPAYHQEGVNPSCGDDIELYIKSDGERITDVSYEGMRCSICLASANMLCEAIRGMNVDEAERLIAFV
ncbi:MAG: Fe-S cluster assembly sulfur transfer protein SufU [Spirochaetota bacterium]